MTVASTPVILTPALSSDCGFKASILMTRVLEMARVLMVEPASFLQSAERVTAAVQDLTGAHCVAFMRIMNTGEAQVVSVTPPACTAEITSEAPILADILRHTVRATIWDEQGGAVEDSVAPILRRL